ncbi:MAG: N-acetyl-gamma-glutamyl-phosphate reductase [Deltaproteobacteria bacterium]|nr:N-acetyl-gamma-glutamyl-phosphate reductase [Deltaproteobacteria bacterium]
MTTTVFVDGQAGTTGLKIHERLSVRDDIELIVIDPNRRKDPKARQECINSADIVFLCLPDEAARESAALATNPKTRIIDASTAHRTHPDWVYGIPELSAAQREKISSARRVAVPGCHATGFNVIVYPLVQLGIVPRDYPLTCHSLTGYSGGGTKLIAVYEQGELTEAIRGPRPYALTLNHKHLPEMQAINSLAYPPLFMPVVANIHSGMIVSVPLFSRLLNKEKTPLGIHRTLAAWYEGQRFVSVMPFQEESSLDGGFLDATACNGTNRLEIFVFGNEEQVLISSRFDNLGKGASGAAIQNMNIMLGVDEGVGL